MWHFTVYPAMPASPSSDLILVANSSEAPIRSLLYPLASFQEKAGLSCSPSRRFWARRIPQISSSMKKLRPGGIMTVQRLGKFFSPDFQALNVATQILKSATALQTKLTMASVVQATRPLCLAQVYYDNNLFKFVRVFQKYHLRSMYLPLFTVLLGRSSFS